MRLGTIGCLLAAATLAAIKTARALFRSIFAADAGIAITATTTRRAACAKSVQTCGEPRTNGSVEERKFVPKPIEACHIALGARVRLIREAIGLTQEDLAVRVKLKRASIASIEIGRQRFLLDTVEDFARALGTTPKHLLKGIWW